MSPPVPTLSLSRDLGGLSSGRAGGGDVRCKRDIAACNRGTGRLARVLCLSAVPGSVSYNIISGKDSILQYPGQKPPSPGGHVPGVWRGCFS